jgi:DNA-binding MarR family transcriptional regulator
VAKTGAASTNSSDETEITLGLLSAVEENSAVTQRSVAQELGIALGLANAYLKRCVKKGLIKVKQIPPNRYTYYLTPKGFAEKTRLTGEYLSASFTFFRRARGQCEAIFEGCAEREWRRVALIGAGDLAEIATLCAREYGIELVGIVAPDHAGGRIAGLPVAKSLKPLEPFDAVLVTQMQAPQAAVDALDGKLAPERILVPAMLRVSRKAEPQDEVDLAEAGR